MERNRNYVDDERDRFYPPPPSRLISSTETSITSNLALSSAVSFDKICSLSPSSSVICLPLASDVSFPKGRVIRKID